MLKNWLSEKLTDTITTEEKQQQKAQSVIGRFIYWNDLKFFDAPLNSENAGKIQHYDAQIIDAEKGRQIRCKLKFLKPVPSVDVNEDSKEDEYEWGLLDLSKKRNAVEHTFLWRKNVVGVRFFDLAKFAEYGMTEGLEDMITNSRQSCDYGIQGEGMVHRTALICASMNNQYDAAHYLICAKANVDRAEWCELPVNPNFFKRTPLMYAAMGGNSDLVKLLLHSDADLHKEDKCGGTAFTLSVAEGQLQIMEVLEDLTCETKRYINSNDTSGWTPLMYACSNGHVKVLKYLLSRSGDINLTRSGDINFKGINSPLNCAVKHPQVVDILLNSGADIHAVNKNGDTPFIHAIKNGASGAVQLFLEFGVNIHQVHQGAMTALHYAAACGRWNVIRILLEYQAQVNAVEERGKSPLHYAVIGGFEKIVQTLVSASAEVARPTMDAVTVFDIALQQSNVSMFTILVQTGCFSFSRSRVEFINFFDLDRITELAYGDYGRVFKAELCIAKVDLGLAFVPVICKMLREWQEIEILQNLPYHRNIHGLAGMCTGVLVENIKRTVAVMLFKEGGSLMTFLKARHRALSNNKLIAFGRDISEAVDHLHKNEYKHCDIAARNFMLSVREDKDAVSPNQCVVLTNFGLTRHIQESHERGTKFAVFWSAPETLKSFGSITNHQTDVWSLGVTFYELCVFPYISPSTRPWEDRRKEHQINAQPAFLDFVDQLESGGELQLPNILHEVWRKLISICCRLEPSERPTTGKILKFLDDVSLLNLDPIHGRHRRSTATIGSELRSTSFGSQIVRPSSNADESITESGESSDAASDSIWNETFGGEDSAVVRRVNPDIKASDSIGRSEFKTQDSQATEKAASMYRNSASARTRSFKLSVVNAPEDVSDFGESLPKVPKVQFQKIDSIDIELMLELEDDWEMKQSETDCLLASKHPTGSVQQPQRADLYGVARTGYVALDDIRYQLLRDEIAQEKDPLKLQQLIYDMMENNPKTGGGGGSI